MKKKHSSFINKNEANTFGLDDQEFGDKVVEKHGSEVTDIEDDIFNIYYVDSVMVAWYDCECESGFIC